MVLRCRSCLLVLASEFSTGSYLVILTDLVSIGLGCRFVL